MLNARKGIFAALLLSVLVLQLHHASAEDRNVQRLIDPAAAPTVTYPSLPAPGEKIQIGNGYYFVYDFNKKPKPGMIIMKVDVYTAEGKKDTSMEILADSGILSKKGAYESGDQPFMVSKNGNYLLPINIVSPGDWEIRLTIKKDGKVLLRGNYQFDVEG